MTDDLLDGLEPIIPDHSEAPPYLEPLGGSEGGRDERVTDNREDHFDVQSGRFHDPDTGEFEPGSPPPDLDGDVNRYRDEQGRFKSRSSDLFDEPAEVRLDSLEPEG